MKTPGTHRKLLNIFAAVAGTILLATAAGCGPGHQNLSGTSAPLTGGEAALAQGFFGAELNPGIVRKNYTFSHAHRAAASVSGATGITFYGAEFHSRDYSREKDLVKFETFLHEMTHIWQNQTQWRMTNGLCERQHYYILSGNLTFADYCHERQAAIVGDYARRFLYNNPDDSWWARGKRGLFSGGRPRSLFAVGWEDAQGRHPGADTPETDALLLKIVEGRFPGARVMRLAIEAQKGAKPAPGARP